jgi:hypothetical protein
MPISGIEFRIESTGQWVDPGDRDPTDEDGLRLRGAGHDGTGYLTVIYANIPGNSWNQNRMDLFMARAQDYIDFRIPLDDPQFEDPDNPGVIIDPDALVDPARPDFFWDSGDLVSRPVIISDVTYSEEAGLSFTLTRAR